MCPVGELAGEGLTLVVSRKKPIRKECRDKGRNVKLFWSKIEPLLPIKNVLILPGDCILPLNNMSLFTLVEDLYTKNSSIKSLDHLELMVSRKIRPFRCFEELFPLLRKVNSQYIPMLKDLITGDYCKYIEARREQRLAIAPDTTVAVSRSSVEFDAALEKYLHELPETFYRYQIRASNEDREMEMKKMGMSQDLMKLLQPETSDILFHSTPRIFRDVDNYLKYMYHNLLSLVKGGQMDWVEISLESEDEVVIETRFKNVYFSTPYSTKLVTITVFDISKSAVTRIEQVRRENSKVENVLVRVNPQAEHFFSKFYSKKVPKSLQRCSFSLLAVDNK